MSNIYSFLCSPYIENDNIFSHLTIASLLFAGLIHDIDHTGKNNMYEINTLSTLAIRYNDASVLENHHAAKGLSILQIPEKNFLRNLTENMLDF